MLIEMRTVRRPKARLSCLLFLNVLLFAALPTTAMCQVLRFEFEGTAAPGTVNGSAQYGPGPNGRGQAFCFNGSTSVETASTPFPSGPFTILYCIFPEKEDPEAPRAFYWGSGQDDGTDVVHIHGNGPANIGTLDGNPANENRVSIGTPAPVGEWSHVALTSEARMYFNGQPVASQNDPVGMTNNPNPVFLGRRPTDVPGERIEAFCGKLDEVMVFDRVLSQGEIDTIYRETCKVTLRPRFTVLAIFLIFGHPQGPAAGDGDSPALCTTDNNVLLHSGEERLERVDLAIPGRGDIHFVMRRTYRSQLDYDGPLGFAWDFNYNDRLFVEPNGDVLRSNGRSHLDTWTKNKDGSFSAPSGFFRNLVLEPDGTYVSRSPNGFKRLYDADGRLQAHVDRNGNRMDFEYDERGNLDRVIDAYGRVIDYTFEGSADGVDRLARITDFLGREVVYSYDENGDLVAVRTPVVVGSSGHDFLEGRTERYTYSTGFEEPALNHNLLSVTYPEEVASGGPAAITWTYGEDPADPMSFDRVIEESIGGGRVNASGVPAGGVTRIRYEMLNEEVPLGDLDLPRGKATLTERNGNVLEYFVNELNHHIITRRLTRGLREGEPEFYETRSFFDADGQLLRRVFPEGNEVRYAYDTAGPRGAQRNVVEVRRVADADRGGGEDLVTAMTYEPLYNRLASVTDPRGSAAGFVPPLGEASAERYTTEFFFDYQEGAGEIPDAVKFGIDLAGVERGRGDLNGDGRTDQVAGNQVRIQLPSVELLPDSKEAARLGSTTQEIANQLQWNDHGQLLRSIDPEGDVTALEYYPANDPDGDGEEVAEPRGGDASGYLRSTTIDAAGVALEATLGYDAVGNVTSIRNPRGIATEIEVNALNEPVAVTRGTEVADAVASGQLITGEAPFRYESRNYYDHNGRVVRREVENRADVSTTEGVGDFVERSYTYDLLNNLVERAVEVDGETTLVWQQRYDENELPTVLTEPEGNQHETTYDERNMPFRITRGRGTAEASTVQIDYDLNANRLRLVDAEDNDGDGAPEVTLLSYDGFDRRAKITDALGNESVTTYDVASNVVRREAFGHPPHALGAGGGAGAPNVLLADVRLLQDELNRTFQVDRALFLSEGFAPVRPVDLQDENSDGFATTRMEFDRDSRRTFTIEDDLQVTQAIYDGADRPVELIDHLGNRVVTEYDQNSNAVSIMSHEMSPEELVPAEVFVTRFVYDQFDRPVRAIDNVGQTVRLAYDSRDNLIQRADPEGALLADPLGLFPGDVNEPGNTKNWFYDGLDRRILQVCDLREGGQGGAPLDFTNPMNPDGQVSLAYDFDGNSRLVGITDDNQNRTSFGYDALNRRTTHTNADGSGFSYIYDRDHNIREATDPNGSVVTNSYDVLNRLVGRDIARAAGIVGTTRESYRYDGVSRLTAKSDDNGTPETTLSCELVYDSLSRLWEERQSVPTSPAPPEPQFIRGDCDGDGFVGGTTADIIFYANWAFLGGEVPACLAACDADGDGFAGGSTADIVYYANFAFLGRQPPPPPFPGCGTGGKALECASYPPCDNGQAAGGGGSQVTGVVSTVWSGDSKRLSCTYPGGRTLMNTFDGVDRYKTTSDAAGPIAECFWIGPRYRELRRVCGNGTSLSFLSDALDADVGYDGVKRVVRMRCFLPDGVTAFLDREYGYNRANMRTSETRHDDFGLTDRYSYDSLYRIARTELDQGGLAGGVPRDTSQIDYQLDGVGNRREVDFTSALNGPVSEVFEVNEMNEYTAIGGVDRSHDDNGNVLDDGERVYAYDYKNRLVSVSDKDNSDPIAQYLYHADNRRAWKTVFSAVPPGRIAKETVYFYDGWRVCEEQDGRAGATETTFVWSPTYVDGLVQLARTASHGLGEGTFYAHQNARADVVALTDGVGEVVERVVYDDFGNPSAVSAVGNPYFFQGRRLDEETGLYYFRNRYYDPGAGRFLQRDPVWDAGNVGGQYTFVGNGPVSAGDPLGLTPISFGPPPAGGPILPGGDQDDVVYPEYEPDPGDEPAPGLPEYSPPDDPPEFKLWLYLAQEIGTPVPWMDWDVDSYLNIYLTVTLTMVCDECENSPATPAADKPWGDLFSGDWYRRQVEEEWRPIVTDPRLRGFLKKQGFTEAEIDNPTFEQVEAMFSAFTSAAGLQQGESGSCEGSLDDPWDALEVWIGGKVVGAGIEAIGATGLFGRFLNLFRAKPPAPKPPTTNPRPGSFEDYPGFTTPNPPKPPRVLSPLRPGGPPPAPPIRPPFDLGSAFRHAFDHPAPGQAGRWRRDLLLDLFAN